MFQLALLSFFCFRGTASENLIWPISVDANIFTCLSSLTGKTLTHSILRRIFFFCISWDCLRNHWLQAASYE
uniref:Putative secreted protein n=1 Tax=Ixodes ricinus TaxID=34613 RepID=A0A6B0TUD2_IXORI